MHVIGVKPAIKADAGAPVLAAAGTGTVGGVALRIAHSSYPSLLPCGRPKKEYR